MSVTLQLAQIYDSLIWVATDCAMCELPLCIFQRGAEMNRKANAERNFKCKYLNLVGTHCIHSSLIQPVWLELSNSEICSAS